MKAGAIGVTCATTDEIVAMVRSGIDDVLLANVVTDGPRVASLAAAAADARVTVAIDSKPAAQLLSTSARRASSEIGFVVDIDLGMGRNGVATIEEAIELADVAAGFPGLTFRGVMGYEGHLVHLHDRSARQAAVEEAFAPVASVVEGLGTRGFDVEMVTGGSTATYDSTGNLPFMTDIQCGTYVLMDASYCELLPDFVPAAAVIATVCSVGPSRDLVVNAGAKRMATDVGKPRLAHLDAPYAETSEEHCQFESPPGDLPRVGERVAVVPGHTCTTMSMYSQVFGIRNGELEQVFRIDARDPLA